MEREPAVEPFCRSDISGNLVYHARRYRAEVSWIYKKIQVLAIFDDLDTIILMIPLQIMMIGLRWQLIIVVVIVFMLLAAVGNS